MPHTDELTRKAYQRAYHIQYKHRKKRLTVMMDAEDYNRFETLAKRDKRKTGAQVIAMAEAYMNNESLVSGDVQAKLDAFTFQLRAIGNNINQIAFCLNADVYNDKEYSASESAHLLKQIWKGLAQMETQVHDTFKKS